MGDPPIDWDQVRTREDIALFLPFRDEYYAGVVRQEVSGEAPKSVIDHGCVALSPKWRTARVCIENELLMALEKPYVILRRQQHGRRL